MHQNFKDLLNEVKKLSEEIIIERLQEVLDEHLRYPTKITRFNIMMWTQAIQMKFATQDMNIDYMVEKFRQFENFEEMMEALKEDKN